MAEVTELKTIPRGNFFELSEDYYYRTKNHLIKVPKGFLTNFASVPRVFRNIINTYGNHTRAAVVHDYLYSKKCDFINMERKEADEIFLEIMIERDVPVWKRQLMYRAVRAFGWACFRKGE